MYKEKSFDLDEAIAVMHSLVLTKEQLRLMKNILKTKNVHFPNTNVLVEARKKLRPVIITTPDKGVHVNYMDLVKQTIEAQISLLDLNLAPDDNIEFSLKDGCDGAGSQTIHKSKMMKDAASNMFVYGIVPLQVKLNSELLWKNPSPNSPNYLRPVYLIREKESDETFINYVISHTDNARNNLNNEGLIVSIEDQLHKVDVKIMDSMKDLKLKNLSLD